MFPEPFLTRSGHTATRDAAARVIDQKPVAEGQWQMRVEAPSLAGAFTPGQFFMLQIPGRPGEGFFLRRPFAPSSYNSDGFSFVYAIRGEGTLRMASLRAGDELRVLAPLGRGYAPPPAPETPAVLVGGGCGLPSMLPLALELRSAGHIVYGIAGAARSGALPCHGDLTAAGFRKVATDDGSEGIRGTAVDALRVYLDTPQALASGPPVLYACGPSGMLRAVAAIARERQLMGQASLEERMACGTGACLGCAVAVREPDGQERYRRVCRDGPVFSMGDVVW